MHYISTFYFFKNLLGLGAVEAVEGLKNIENELYQQKEKLDLKGLMILAEEGLNSTFSAPSADARSQFQDWLRLRFNEAHIFFKDSESAVIPFPVFKVKIRKEACTTHAGIQMTPPKENHHLNPSQWEATLKSGEPIRIIDTRNDYEFRIGSFKNAVNPAIDKFSDFPKYFEAQKISPEEKILIFCTGGVRCEKGILDLQQKGYQNVFQLEGGIINYLKDFPNSEFKGECFVFDHRVSVDQNLAPSQKYGLCPHCGDPAGVPQICPRCDFEFKICEDCDVLRHTCSKNCDYHWKLRPGIKGARQHT